MGINYLLYFANIRKYNTASSPGDNYLLLLPHYNKYLKKGGIINNMDAIRYIGYRIKLYPTEAQIKIFKA